MSDMKRFDNWFEDEGPAALVQTENLLPVDGAGGVFFPATYAAQQGAERDKDKFQGGYNIDEFPNGTNVCLIDSVGSQANRIEPLFSKEKYRSLVPQVTLNFPDKGIVVNLLEANHRAADALFRCSSLESRLREAFKEVLRGNYEPLAKIAPTSLVFGVWDSRDTSAKVPRLFSSTIRAYNVFRHTRSANFLVQMTVDLNKLEILPGADSKEGFANALASRAPGGIQLRDDGVVRRDVAVSLPALRRIAVIDKNGRIDDPRTLLLRRYVLGLSLVALTAPRESFLRQGCNLVPDSRLSSQPQVVGHDGKPAALEIDAAFALTYAQQAAKDFVVGENIEAPFDVALAQGKSAKLSGKVKSVDMAGKSFVVDLGKGKEQAIRTESVTEFKKANVDSSFEDVVVVGTKIAVEVRGEIAKSVATSK